MRTKPLKPVVREWAWSGAISLAYGLVATIWAVVGGHSDWAEAIAFAGPYTGLTALLTIRPSLRNMEAAAAMPDGLDVQTSRQAVRNGVLGALALAALIGLAAALLPSAMCWVGLLGLATGVLWSGAAAIVRSRERHRLHGRLLAGRRVSRFQPASTRFYLTSSS